VYYNLLILAIINNKVCLADFLVYSRRKKTRHLDTRRRVLLVANVYLASVAAGAAGAGATAGAA
jgi:hypothetical protein